MSLLEELNLYQTNVTPPMQSALGESLGLPPGSDLGFLQKLGLGFLPAKHAWVIPERDNGAKVIGLSLRQHHTGNKWMLPDGKRGFIFSPEFSSRTNKNNHLNYVRVSNRNLCPVCDKPDWCLIVKDDRREVVSVICARVKSGKKAGDAGYIHQVKEWSGGGFSLYDPGTSGTLDPPIIIVEGFSDWMVASVLGFPAIGKPSAQFNTEGLKSIVSQRDVVIMGDNDEPGRRGVEETFETLREECKTIVKLFPPEGIKDLRGWFTQSSLTSADFLNEITSRGSTSLDGGILTDNVPLTIGLAWLEEDHKVNGVIAVRNYKNIWVRYKNGTYAEYSTNVFRGDLYRYLQDKMFLADGPKGGKVLRPVKPDRNLINNIIDSLNAWCVVSDDPPCWLDDATGPDPSKLIAFKNGILDITDYNVDDTQLLPSTPSLFTMSPIPHKFNHGSAGKCNKQLDTIWDILSEDEEKFALLQEWFGYMLIADNRFEKMMLFIGRPRSGKGTILDLMTAMLGSKQVAVTSFANLCSSFGYQTLVGKLAAILPDASMPRNLDATHALEKIKNITGGDAVNVNMKFKDEIPNLKLYCRFTIAVNTIPDLPDHAQALEPRLNIISFDESYLGREDRNLKYSLTYDKEGIEGLIMWSLEGLQRLYDRQKFTMPESSKIIYQEFQELTTPVADFIADCCDIGGSEEVERQQLYECWRNWANENGLHPGPQNRLGQRILSLHPTLTPQLRFVNRRRFRIYSGISLTEQAKKTYLEGGRNGR